MRTGCAEFAVSSFGTDAVIKTERLPGKENC